jgi:carbonic anhydrase/acetyltransferase-like protein (isoleucine patch superfamily)
MIIGNEKPIRIIGYHEASMTYEFLSEITRTHPAEIITPEEFYAIEDHLQYQYIIAVCKLANRKLLVDYVDRHNLDLITYIHDSVVLASVHKPVIGPGTFIFSHSTALTYTSIGRHCIIGCYCLIGHYSKIGNNCQLRPGVLITGKSSIGNNCMLNVKVTVTNKVSIGDNIELMAFSNVIKNLSEPGRYIGSGPKKFNTLPSPNEL